MLSPQAIATEHGLTAMIVEDVSSQTAVATEHSSGAPIVEDVSSPPAVATEHGLTSIIAEDVLEVVIPFLTMSAPAHSLCDRNKNRTPCIRTGEHFHIWCYRCANLPDNQHSAATHDACQDCRIVRTLIQLSERWQMFMWEQHPITEPTMFHRPQNSSWEAFHKAHKKVQMWLDADLAMARNHGKRSHEDMDDDQRQILESFDMDDEWTTQPTSTMKLFRRKLESSATEHATKTEQC